jgi:hypothetical protein
MAHEHEISDTLRVRASRPTAWRTTPDPLRGLRAADPALAPQRRAAQHPVKITVALLEAALQPADVRGDLLAQHLGRAAEPVALGGDHLNQFAAPCDQRLELEFLRVGQPAHFGSHPLGEQRQHARIERIGLGQLSAGAREVAHLARVDHHHRHAGRAQLGNQCGLQPTARLQHHQCRPKLDQPCDQTRDPARIVRHLQQLTRRAQRHVQARLAHIDPNPQLSFHRSPSVRLRPCPSLRDAGSRQCGPGDCSGSDLR